MCYHWLWWMLPRHISLVLPLSLLWLLCQFCFLSYVLWPELGGLGSRESCSFSCCLDSLAVATTLRTHCVELQLDSAESCHLFSCCFPSVAFSLCHLLWPSCCLWYGSCHTPRGGIWCRLWGRTEALRPHASACGHLGLFWSFVTCIFLKPGWWKLWVTKMLCQTGFSSLLFPERLQAGKIVLCFTFSFLNSPALGGPGISPTLNISPQITSSWKEGKDVNTCHLCACSVAPFSWVLFCPACWCSPLGVLGRTPCSQPPQLSLQLPGEGGTKAVCLLASGDSWWLSSALETCALLQVLGGGWTLCCCFLGVWWEFLNFYLLQWGVTERDPPLTRLEGSSALSCPV